MKNKQSLVLACGLGIGLISAYVQAMTSDQILEFSPLQWELFFKPMPLLFFIASLFIAALIWFLWRKREEVDFLPSPKSLGASDRSLKLFYGWVPVILGVHVAIPLLINGVQGSLFYASNHVQDVWANWIGLVEILIALSLFYGGLTRPAAVLIGLLWVLGIDSVGLKPMLNSIQYLGFASFFYLAGRGPYSIDRILFPKLEPTVNYVNYALLFLRISVGLNFIIFGFTEKFANIPQALSLVENHPFLNFTFIANEPFILFAAAIEVLGGILITLGIFPRSASLIALICINASLTISHWHELIDYLPLYAALAVFLIWEPHNPKQKLLWVDGIREPH